MERTLKVLNDLERTGLIKQYALAGAVAALFYMDPFETEDLDVFVMLAEPTHALLPLGPLYDEIRRLGYREDGPYVMIEGVPVQFLPAYNPLIEEAVAEAKAVAYDSIMTRVPRAEHLAAIMIQTGRQKDRVRFDALRDQVALDETRLAEIVARHGLKEKYQAWTQ